MSRRRETRTALVTGGTGTIGPILVRHLLANDYHVKVLARHKPAPGLLPEFVPVILGDITDDRALSEATRNTNFVFHLAAKLHVPNPSLSLASEYERVNVEGTRLLVEAAQSFRVDRIIFFSSICVYGDGHLDQVFSENSEPQPCTLYAKTKYRAEKIVLEARNPESGKKLGVVLRLAAVYGPSIKGNYANLVEALRRGWFIPVGSGLNRRTVVHQHDVATAALLAAEHPQAVGQVYNVTDGQITPFKDILSAICAGLNQSPPEWSMPVYPVRLLFGLAERGFQWLGKPAPVGQFTVDKLVEDLAVSGEKIRRDLGFQAQVDLQTGWLLTIQQMRP